MILFEGFKSLAFKKRVPECVIDHNIAIKFENYMSGFSESNISREMI